MTNYLTILFHRHLVQTTHERDYVDSLYATSVKDPGSVEVILKKKSSPLCDSHNFTSALRQ
jgi:hypothetical protein